MNEAVIDSVRLGAAHDGEAELVVTLRFGNGGRSDVTLDRHAVAHLMDASGAAAPDALVGCGWRLVRDAVAASANRFVTGADQISE